MATGAVSREKKRPERELVIKPHLLPSLTISGVILEFLHRPSRCAQVRPVVRFILNIHYLNRDMEEFCNIESNDCVCTVHVVRSLNF